MHVKMNPKTPFNFTCNSLMSCVPLSLMRILGSFYCGFVLISHEIRKQPVHLHHVVWHTCQSVRISIGTEMTVRTMGAPPAITGDVRSVLGPKSTRPLAIT